MSAKPEKRISNSSDQKLFFVIFPYDTELVSAARGLPERRFDNAAKRWTVPAKNAHIDALLKFADRYNFEITQNARNLMHELASAEQARETQRAANVSASRAETADIEIAGLGGELRPFQRAGVAYALKAQRCFIADEMGLGKTVEALATIQAANAYPALVVCPASLKLNWEREARKWLPGKSVAVWNGRAEQNQPADVVVINYDVLKKNLEALKALKAQAVVFDESHYCFPAGTMVSTDQGDMPIEEIVKNRLAISVASCDLSHSVLEYKEVIDWFEFPIYISLVRITHERGEFVCTADHPIWTEENGYVEASSLIGGSHLRVVSNAIPDTNKRQGHSPLLYSELCGASIEQQTRSQTSDFGSAQASNARGAYLRVVQSGIQSQVSPFPKFTNAAFLWRFMRGILENESSTSQGAVECCYQEGAGSEDWSRRSSIIGTYEAEQSDVQSGNGGKDATDETGTNIPITRRQWSIDRTAETFGCTNRIANGVFDLHSSSEGPIPIIADSLQSRSGGSDAEISNRSGWPFAPDKAVEVFGQAENFGFERSRVVSIEILESGSSGGNGTGDRRNSSVYCLSVADNENFFADGVLVSNCKNYKAQRTEACKELAKGAEYRLALTGTPVLNRPQELLSQLGILNRLNDFGGFWTFAKRYCNAHKTRFGWDFSGAAHLDELNEKLRASCFIRRNKADVLKELPAKTRANQPMELSNRREYERAERDLISYLREQAANDKEFLASIADKSPEEQRKLKAQRASSAEQAARRAEQLVRIEALKQLAARGKLNAAFEWVESFLETGEKLVVFAHHREIVEAIAEKFQAPAITGETLVEKRQEYVDRFQNDLACNLIVLNIRAGGVGLTLTAASNVAFVELDWTPAAHDQAEDRTHRIGQSNAVTAWYLLADNTIDTEIASLIESKRRVVDAATDGKEPIAQDSIFDELLENLQR